MNILLTILFTMCIQIFMFVSTMYSQFSKPFGSNIWMTSNLSVNTFRNGDTILHARTSEEWIDAAKKGIPAWCFFNNDEGHGKIHGALYNHHAVLDSRGLAPKGWHIPDIHEWKSLFAQFGGENEAGFALLSKKHWFVSEWNPPINVEPSGFEAYGSGQRDMQGNFSEFETLVGFFTINNEQIPLTTTSTESTDGGEENVEVSIEYDSPKIQVFILNNLTKMIGKYDIQNGMGYSVRCVKD